VKDWKAKLALILWVGSSLAIAIFAGLEERNNPPEVLLPTVEQPAYGGKLAGNYGLYSFSIVNVWKCLDDDCDQEGYMTRVTVTAPNTKLEQDFEKCGDEGHCSFNFKSPFEFSIFLDEYWRLKVFTERGYDIYMGEIRISTNLGGKTCNGDFVARYPVSHEPKGE
jgi:hypothetical protein